MDIKRKRTVLVTGCSTGFGRLLAERAARRGHTVFAKRFALASAVVAVASCSGPAPNRETPSMPAQETAMERKLPTVRVSAEFPFESTYATAVGARIHYVEAGRGDPIVFIHGNPTSSYLWRNVIPYAAEAGRAIAFDMIGMGKSDKPDIEYTFADHYRFLEAFLSSLSLDRVTFVVHDWGAALGFEYARRNPNRVAGIAFMEGLLPPAFPQPTFEAMGDEMGGMFRAFKDPEQGKKLVIEDHIFVEKVLPGFVDRPLGEAEMQAYRAPYEDESARRPLLAWPREVPIAGEPPGNVKLMEGIAVFMAQTDIPMLLLYASPGVLVPPEAVPWYTERIDDLETVYIGRGLHFIQEDQPDAIGRAIRDWLRRHRKSSTASNHSSNQEREPFPHT